MSTTQTNAGMPDVLPLDQALAGVHEGVHAEAFFHKLASIAPHLLPNNQDEAISLLELGSVLDQLPDSTEKAASTNRFAGASDAIFGTLSRHGYSVPSIKQAEIQENFAISQHLLSNPATYQACSSALLHKLAAQADVQQ